MGLFREKAKRICTKSQYGEASWWETIQLNIFLLFSKNLAEFSEKNSKFTTLCDQANFQSLTEEEKDKIKKAMEDKF